MATMNMNNELFCNQHFRVVDQLTSDKSVLVVCFANAASIGFHGVDFGQKFLSKIGLSGIFIHSAEADWFQHESIFEAVSIVREVSKSFDQTVLLGDSMGAYIALDVSQCWPADHVITFGPVSNINPDLPPFETRFLDHFSNVKNCRSITSLAAKKYSLVYDPCDFDQRHVMALDLPDDRTHHYRIYGGSHRPQIILRDIGVLSEFTSSLIRNGHVTSELFSHARSAKRDSEYYWISLFRRNLKNRPAVAKLAVDRLEAMGALPRRLPLLRRKVERRLLETSDA